MSLFTWCILGGTHCTRVCVVTEPYTPEPFYVECCGSGVQCSVVTGCGKGTEGRVFSLSYNIEHAVAQKNRDIGGMSELMISSISSSKDSMWSEGRSCDEEGEHNVENIMLCYFAHHACSPLLQGFVHEAKLCKVALTCRFALDVI